MILLHIASALLIVLEPPSLGVYTLSMLLMNVSVAFVDTLAEGLSAMITKMDSRILILKNFDKKEGEELEKENSMKAFGAYNAIRTFFRTIMGFVGGILSSRISVRAAFAMIGAYPAVMLIYTIVVFSEEKVRNILV